MKETWLVEDGQTEIGGLELSIVMRAIEQEILRFEISMHNTKRMTSLNNTENGLDQLSSLTLAEMSLRNDPIEKLTTFADLHNNVNKDGVFVSALDPNNVWVLGEVMHDLNLSPHILVVFAANELALRD